MLAEFGGALHLPVKCDADENVYLRPYEQDNSHSSVLKVSHNADKETRLDSLDPALKGLSVQDFAVSPDNTVYELLQAGNDVYIAQFHSDGSFASKMKLEDQFWGVKLAVAMNGTAFLVSGVSVPNPTGGNGGLPKLITAMFDQSGRRIGKLSLDNDPADPGVGGKQLDTKKFLNDVSVLPLVNGNIEADRDGTLLLMRASTNPVIFVLDSRGKMARRMVISAPLTGMSPASMHVRAGKLAMLFERLDAEGNVGDRIMTVFDIATGEKVREYSVAPSLGTAFACYLGGDNFGFVTSKNNKFALQYAAPER
jgi:hypothetical protein